MAVKCNKPIVIIMGPPGSGKGTQALLLADKFGSYYYEPAKIIEAKIMNAKKGDYEIINGKKFSLLDEKINWETGILVSPELISYWGKAIIEDAAKSNEGIIFAGTPRTLYEAQQVMPLLEKLYKKENIKTILLTLKPEETMWRNSHRKICTLMRHPVIYDPETKNLKICPLDGSKLVMRKGLDDPKSIKVRLMQYKERTLPVVNYLKKHKFSVKTISAVPSPSVIFANILKALNIE